MATLPRKSAPGPRLGERLVRAGIITEQQLQQALEVQSRNHGFLGQIVVDLGFTNSEAVGRFLARDFGLSYVDLMEARPETDALRLIPERLIRTAKAIPLRRVGDSLHVAMVDPLNVGAIDSIHHHTGLRVIPHLAMAGELQRAMNDLFDATARTSEALEELLTENPESAGPTREELVAASEAPIVRLVSSIIESALAARASDIHFEPYDQGLRVRYRVDGTLIEHASIPKSQRAPVIARLKVLCLMDITENRRPQDGRMMHNDNGRVFDIRVSSMPTVFGEKIVLRILDKSSVLVPLGKLGFRPDQQRRFEQMIRQPHGLVVVVGPTGSGKSTTLYASMNLLNDSKRNIMTLEDPVEYNVQGLNQVQVNTRIGLTFASGLRSFVRQDPDVILVGEIRDSETAEMAVQASLTGHLVLSTLHTNSAVGTVPRLVNLGLSPFLIAQALVGVVSQRLVARICTQCATDYHPDRTLLDSVGITAEEAANTRFRRGAGCRSCHERGYLGRIALYEVMTINEEIRQLIMQGTSEHELQRAVEGHGMLSLRASALAAIRDGITTPEEMGRVVLAKEV